MKRTLLAALAAALMAASAPCGAKWARLGEDVPVERLVRNLSQRIAANPRDAEALYVLGRVHCFAWATAQPDLYVDQRDAETRAVRAVPGFPPYSSPLYAREPGKPADAAAAGHLRASLAAYRRAAQADPASALYALGYGWVCEQAASAPDAAGAPSGAAVKGAQAIRAAWSAEGLRQYRRAYASTRDADRKAESRHAAGLYSIAREAGLGIQRLLAAGSRTRTPAERALLADIADTLKIVDAKPAWITPIVVAPGDERSVAQLLASGSSTRFDLAGAGAGDRWPWVRPDTGILAWDPGGAGRIRSGRQLFGSATWWMLWRTGYAALAALDDNRDGWLAGRELRGIAVWRDRNGNGVSDPGEVVPAAAFGIARIAVRPAGPRHGAPGNPRGVILTGGGARATFDWTPTSLGRGPAAVERGRSR